MSSQGQFRKATHVTLDIREMWVDDPYETIPGFKEGGRDAKRGALALFHDQEKNKEGIVR